MRARIALPLLLVMTAAVLLLLGPTLESLASRRTTELNLERSVAVEHITDLARQAAQDGSPQPLQRYVSRYHALFGEDVLVVDADGRVLARAGDLEPTDDDVARRIRDFGYNLADLDVPVVRPWSATSLLVSTPVELGRDLSSGAVVMRLDLSDARADVRREWLVVLVPTGLLLVLLALATHWTTGWVLRPVHRLDEATLAMASGERPAGTEGFEVSGPPELRRLARSFRAMTASLWTAVDQQRDLVANTSHQLRNPLAAVRLHVDLLAREVPQAGGRIQVIQRDLDRVDTTLDRLLALAEAEHRVSEQRAERTARAEEDAGPPTTSPGELRGMVADRWSDLDGSDVRVEVEGGPAVAVPTADLSEMVDTVVENAVKYAGPGASILVRLVAGGEGRALVHVDDDGDGLTEEELQLVGTRFWRSSRHATQTGTGLGLALVGALARANGGAMHVARSPRGGLGVTLDLPRAS